jgi:hypothetical protein
MLFFNNFLLSTLHSRWCNRHLKLVLFLGPCFELEPGCTSLH